MHKILVVDDHAVVREGIISILKKNILDSIVCDEAGTVREAEEKLACGKYDLLLLDISMPGENGLEFLAKLQDTHPGVRVLVISMHSEEQYAMKALSLQAAGYLTKERAPAELVLAVNKVLAGERYISSTLADQLADRMFSANKTTLPHETLSSRECQVLSLIGAGKTPKQIGSELSISEKTVSTYRTRVLRKLGMTSTAEMMNYAIRHDLA